MPFLAETCPTSKTALQGKPLRLAVRFADPTGAPKQLTDAKEARQLQASIQTRLYTRCTTTQRRRAPYAAGDQHR
jgi:hypothetical protein